MHWGFLAHLPGLPDLPSEEWSRLGSLDVFRVKTFGEWYRCVTALTLHADSQAPLRQCPVRRAFSDPALPQGGPRAWPLSYLAGRKLRQRPQRMVPPRRAYQPRLLHGPFRHGGRAFRIMALQGWGSRTQSDTGKLSWRRGILLLAAGTGILARLGTEGDKTVTPHTCSGCTPAFIVGGAAGMISRRTAPSPVINTLLGLSAAGAGRAVLEVGVLTSFFLIAILLSNR